MYSVIQAAWRFLTGAPLQAGVRTKRGKARFWGAVIAMSISMIPLVLVQQVTEGMIIGISRRFIETGSYHLQGIARSVPDTEKLEHAADTIRGFDGVQSVVTERQGFGLLYSDKGRSGVTIRAVPQAFWDNDPAVRSLINVTQGSFTVFDKRDIVIGVETARRLNASIGDELRLLTVRSAGEKSMLSRISKFRVRGIISTGYRALDQQWVFISHERGLRVIPAEMARDIIGIKIDNPLLLPNPLFQRGIQGILSRKEQIHAENIAVSALSVLDSNWLVYDWYSLEEGRYLSFLTSRNLLSFIMFVIVFVAVIHVSSVLVLLVIEKEEDIAILRSLGTSRKKIAAIFIICGFIIASIGTLIGAAAGVLLALNINAILSGIESIVSIFASRAVHLLNAEFYLETIPVEILPIPLAASIFFVILLSVCTAVFPAMRAGKVLPEKILRKQG